MPNKTSESLKKDVIRLYILGHTSLEIHDITGTSTGNISNIIAKFKEKMDSGDLESVVDFVRCVKDKKLSLSDACDGFATSSLLRKLSVDKAGFEKFAELYSKSVKDGLEPAALADSSLALCDIRAKTDMPIEKIPQHYDDLLAKSQTLESEIKTLVKQKQDLQDQVNKELEKRNVTFDILERYDSDKKSLLQLGLDVDDPLKFAKMIGTAKESKFNISEINEHLTKEKSHDKRILDKERILEQQEIKITNYNKTKDSLSKKISSLKQELDELSETYRNEKNSILSIKKLQKSGITSDDIIRWKNTLDKCGIDPTEIDENVRILDDVINATNNTRDKIHELEVDLSKKLGQKKALSKEINSKKSQLETLDTRISDTIKDHFATIRSESTKTVQKFKTLLDFHDMEIKSKRNNQLNVFENNLKDVVTDIREATAELTRIANVDAKFSFLEPLYLLCTESSGEKTKVYLSMIHLLTGLEAWNKKHDVSFTMKSKIRHLKEEFNELLSRQALAS